MLNLLSRFPVAVWPIYLLILMLLLTLAGDYVSNLLRFDQQAIAQGEIWRLFTGHIVHLGWAHGLLNAGGLLLVAWMQPKGSVMGWLLFYLVTSVLISIFLYMQGSVVTYVGASGVLHGLLIMAAFFSEWLEPWRQKLIILLIGGKLIWEQTPWYSDASVADLIGGYVVVDAHFIGGIAGLLVVFCTFAIKSVKSGAPS